MTRYLSTYEKEHEVQSFFSYREDASHFRQPHHRGGKGFIDPEVLSLVDTLNEIHGVCTIQSCCGHKYEARPGQLWIRLDEQTSWNFDKRVEILIQAPSIRQVKKLYSFESQAEVHEVIDITFKGLEASERWFNRSASTLIRFFESVGSVL